jgi:hypothetical protein
MIGEYHRLYIAKGDKVAAIREMIRDMGFVTLMIHANNAFAFLTLYLTRVVPLQEFGLVAFWGTMASLWADGFAFAVGAHAFAGAYAARGAAPGKPMGSGFFAVGRGDSAETASAHLHTFSSFSGGGGHGGFEAAGGFVHGG